MKKITFAQSLLEGYYDDDTREQITQRYAAARAHFPDDSPLSKRIAELEQLDKNTALLTHASEGDIDEVMLDLENGADPTFKQSVAYKQAFIDGHYDVARLLRQRGASNPTVDQRLDNLSESITGKFGSIKHLLESHSEDDSYWSDEQEDKWREDDKYQNWEDAHRGAADGPDDSEEDDEISLGSKAMDLIEYVLRSYSSHASRNMDNLPFDVKVKSGEDSVNGYYEWYDITPLTDEESKRKHLEFFNSIRGKIESSYEEFTENSYMSEKLMAGVRKVLDYYSNNIGMLLSDYNDYQNDTLNLFTASDVGIY